MQYQNHHELTLCKVGNLDLLTLCEEKLDQEMKALFLVVQVTNQSQDINKPVHSQDSIFIIWNSFSLFFCIKCSAKYAVRKMSSRRLDSFIILLSIHSIQLIYVWLFWCLVSRKTVYLLKINTFWEHNLFLISVLIRSFFSSNLQYPLLFFF